MLKHQDISSSVIISVVTFILILTFMLDLVVILLKEKKSLMVGSRVWLEQVFLSLVMEKLKKNKCVAVKQNTVESRFTDTSLTPMCCNKPFLLEGK